MIKVLIKADYRYPVNRKQIRQKVKKILESKGVTANTQVAVMFVGDRKMKQLNSQYRRKQETTDVLSFSFTEGKVAFPIEDVLNLGEVVISYPQARKQAGQYNILVDEEIDKLVEHGLLHLLGLHHE